MQGIEMTLFMKLCKEYLVLKGKTCQHAGLPRATYISGAICMDTPSPYCFCLLCPKCRAITSFGHMTSWNGATSRFQNRGIELLRVRVLTAWYAAEDKIKPIKESGPQSLFRTSAPKLISTALASGGLSMPISLSLCALSSHNNQQHLPPYGIMALIREPSFPEESRKYEMLGSGPSLPRIISF